MTLTEALARYMLAGEHPDADPATLDHEWANDPDLRNFWTIRAQRNIAFMAEWRVRTRLNATPTEASEHANHAAVGELFTNCGSNLEPRNRQGSSDQAQA